MDKLTIEEKAKAYDFSLKRAKRLYEQGTITESLSYVFPQLKKLGDGEVRKEIIQLIQGMHDADPRKERWLTWLEKQKPSERNSDWSDEDERIRKSLSDYFVKFKPNDMWDADFSFGDIVAWLEKQGEPTDTNPSEFDLHLNKLLKQFETLPKEELASSLSFYLNVVQNDGTYREEKQGEQKPQRMISAEAKEAMYGKPAWSEEDDAIRNDLINYFRGSALETPEKEVINFLKSLKDRVQSQPKQEENKGNLGGISSNWSEEDERIVRTIISDGSRGVEFDMLQINWLKSLKQRI